VTDEERQRAIEDAARAALNPSDPAAALEAIGRALDTGADGDDIRDAMQRITNEQKEST